MKKIFTAFVLLLASHAWAQNCFTKKDPFTGKTTTVASTPLVGSVADMSPTIHLIKSDTTYSIGYSFKVALDVTSFAPEKMYLALKFANGDVKKINANKDTRVVSAFGSTVVAFYGDILIADLKQLLTSRVNIIRLSYTGDDSSVYDMEVKESRGVRLMDSINCILN